MNMSDYYEPLRTFSHAGLMFQLSATHDDSHGKPWEEEDGHIEVREVDDVRRKRAGDVVLAEHDRGRGGYVYNVPEAMAKARAESWGVCDSVRAAMREDLGREPSQREVWARAVAIDAARMRAWLRDEWEYRVLRVELLDMDGDAVPGCVEYLGGCDSDGGDEWHMECATNMADEIIARHGLERLHWLGVGAKRVRIRVQRPRTARIYRGVAILPADANASGIRWTARLDNGTRLRAETLRDIKALISRP